MSRVSLIDAPRQLPTQCEETISTMTSPPSQFYTEYRKNKSKAKGYNHDCCHKSAKYVVDGRKLCAFHAGIAALDILMS